MVRMLGFVVWSKSDRQFDLNSDSLWAGPSSVSEMQARWPQRSGATLDELPEEQIGQGLGLGR